MTPLDKIQSELVLKVLDVVKKHHYDEVTQSGKDFSYHFLGAFLKKLDPCVKGKNHKWLLSLISKNPDASLYSLFPDPLAVHDLLFEFIATKQYLPIILRDIGMYKSIEDLQAHLYAARLSSGKKSKKLLASMSIDSTMSEARVQYEGQDIIIFKPRNIEQAILLGDGAKWSFDDRDGGLYKSLRGEGVILIWYTSSGRYISVIPHHSGGGDFLLDENCDPVAFDDVAVSYSNIDDDDESLITSVIFADRTAPFSLNWSVSSKVKAVTAYPILLEDYDIRENIKEIEEHGTLGESYWARTVLDSYMSFVGSLSVTDSIL